MPQTTLEQRRDMSVEELRARATEMRSEWAELAVSDRESDDFRSAKVQFLQEIDDIDLNITAAQRACPRSGAFRQLGPGRSTRGLGSPRPVRSRPAPSARSSPRTSGCSSGPAPPPVAR